MYLSAANHRIPLSDGNSIPIIGLGTYSEPKLTPKGTCAKSVKIAIDTGYRHIDGAYIYQNEHEVGEAIREKTAKGKVRREDIFYCGKPGDEIYPKDENGKWLYHKSNLCATWEGLEACKDAGLVKSLGVSNFNRRQLELILNKPGLKHKPVSNQIFDFSLTEEEMKDIEALNKNVCFVEMLMWCDHPEYPFHDEY
ncbi:aldo-keto reductase family 1 member D1-like isoform X2 [Canis lupus baileyi]|uniref:aldo-keto reductase family 1 member D1-like isoform X2 n=1 Tax=Canis lupus baileyi TaxID=143281 RepID=UPI003B970822